MPLKEDFGLAYADALTKIFNEWLHDEDGGCDYDAVGQRKVYPHNNILMIFQPKGSDGWIEDASIIFTLTKEAKAAGHKLNLGAFTDIIETVNKKLYDAFCNFLSTSQNKWFYKTQDKYDNYEHFVTDFCGMKKPLQEEKGVIKFTYEIKYFYMEYNINYWNPIELINWMKPSDDPRTDYLEDYDSENISYLIERGITVTNPQITPKLAGNKRPRDEEDDSKPAKRLRQLA